MQLPVAKRDDATRLARKYVIRVVSELLDDTLRAATQESADGSPLRSYPVYSDISATTAVYVSHLFGDHNSVLLRRVR